MTYSIIDEYSLEDLGKKNYTFRVPLYQRKYAWTSDEVTILLNDLKTAKDKNLDNYFIGNIVVEKKYDGTLDIIDGQQRFTTLYLMAKIANKHYYELNYEIREADNIFLKDFEYNPDTNIDYANADSQFKVNIEAILEFKKENKEAIEELLERCKITLTILPEGIDIVKYFEVMNNRGKQLEKHQILKAQFLKAIKNNEENINYAKIWDYCSNMNVYIEDSIYYGDLKKDEKNFERNVRVHLRNFVIDKKIPQVFKDPEDNNYKTINEILDYNNNNSKDNKEEFYIRKEYGSIVKFPVFLIQVLKIYLSIEKIQNSKKISDIRVNDRYLIEYFYHDNDFLFNENSSKDFIKFLLKMRILYDYFIFKRDDKDEPFLSKEKNIITTSRDNKNILMLQLLFSFTSPQYITQDWLAVTLKWLNKKDINENEFYDNYFGFLQQFDKELAKVRLSDERIIDYINKKIIDSANCRYSFVISKNLEELLSKGTSTPHYWFYKLDYYLWKDFKWTKSFEKPFKKLNYPRMKSIFRLTRLNSIEHIHPQSKKDTWKDKNVDDFGNLALISNHMNSALNAQQGISKRLDIQKQINNGTIESLKMILAYSQYDEWNEVNSSRHQEEMISILKASLK